MAKPYFTLVSKIADEAAQPARWAIEFGDFDRATVVEEMHDMKTHDRNQGVKCAYRILRTDTARQAAINAAVDELNLSDA